MNLSVIQTMASMNVGNTSQVGKPAGSATSATGNSFGSVFGSLAASTPVAVTTVPTQSGNQISDDAVLAIFNAVSVEELGQAFQAVVGKGVEEFEVPVDFNQEKNEFIDERFPLHSVNLQKISKAIGIEPEQLIESLRALFEKAGVKESELAEFNTMTVDLWQMIDMIDKVAPRFFEQLSDALSGKGDIPKQQAVELLAMLKAVTIIAPKSDLVLKQEQQIFHLEIT